MRIFSFVLIFVCSALFADTELWWKEFSEFHEKETGKANYGTIIEHKNTVKFIEDCCLRREGKKAAWLLTGGKFGLINVYLPKDEHEKLEKSKDFLIDRSVSVGYSVFDPCRGKDYDLFFRNNYDKLQDANKKARLIDQESLKSFLSLCEKICDMKSHIDTTYFHDTFVSYFLEKHPLARGEYVFSKKEDYEKVFNEIFYFIEEIKSESFYIFDALFLASLRSGKVYSLRSGKAFLNDFLTSDLFMSQSFKSFYAEDIVKEFFYKNSEQIEKFFSISSYRAILCFSSQIFHLKEAFQNGLSVEILLMDIEEHFEKNVIDQDLFKK